MHYHVDQRRQDLRGQVIEEGGLKAPWIPFASRRRDPRQPVSREFTLQSPFWGGGRKTSRFSLRTLLTTQRYARETAAHLLSSRWSAAGRCCCWRRVHTWQLAAAAVRGSVRRDRSAWCSWPAGSLATQSLAASALRARPRALPSRENDPFRRRVFTRVAPACAGRRGLYGPSRIRSLTLLMPLGLRPCASRPSCSNSRANLVRAVRRRPPLAARAVGSEPACRAQFMDGTARQDHAQRIQQLRIERQRAWMDAAREVDHAMPGRCPAPQITHSASCQRNLNQP